MWSLYFPYDEGLSSESKFPRRTLTLGWPKYLFEQ